METPRGFNPIGQSAPGLPRHDAPLPGHVPGSFQNIGGADAGTYPMPVGGGFPFPKWMIVWMSRGVFLLATYLTVPVQVCLYPLAGIGGLLAAGVTYWVMAAGDATLESREGGAWMACFIGLLALMRIETNYEGAHPHYLQLRQGLRLVLTFIAMTWFELHEQHVTFGPAVVVAAITCVIVHFVLRWRLVRALWHVLQTDTWVRRRGNETLTLLDLTRKT